MATEKTMIKSPSFNKFFFDAVFSTEHQASVTVTKHPVQQGASITDHSYVEPNEVTLDIGMSDSMAGAGADHSVNAYATLRAMMVKREPLKLVTRLQVYNNMLITSMSAPDDKTTMNALRCTIYFTEIGIVSVAVVQIQQNVSGSKSSSSSSSSGKTATAAAKTATTSKTTKTTKQTKTSVAKQIYDKLTKK